MEINGLAFLLITGAVLVFFDFDSALIWMRGRLFNLFKLFGVVASKSLSFSFDDLLPSPLFSLAFPLLRLLFKGDGRILFATFDVALFPGRFMLRRDVGLGAIEAFSVVFSVTLSCSSLDGSVTAASVVEVDPFLPRFLKLKAGLDGRTKRDAVVLSTSFPSTDLSVLPRKLNRFLPGLLRNLFDENFGVSDFSETDSLTSSDGAGVVLENRDPLERDEPNEGLLKRLFADDDSAGVSVVVAVEALPWNLKRFEFLPAVKDPLPLGVINSVVD